MRLILEKCVIFLFDWQEYIMTMCTKQEQMSQNSENICLFFYLYLSVWCVVVDM